MNQVVTCSECQSSGIELKLKTFSCGHEYCTRCLFQITRRQQGYMPCPKCRLNTLHSLVAGARYHQLSGSLCNRHAEPLDIYCQTCKAMTCKACTMLEHRPFFGHYLIDKTTVEEDRFKNLFEAMEQVKDAQKRLEETASSVSAKLTRSTDIIGREIRDISERIVDTNYEQFQDVLRFEFAKLDGMAKIVKNLQKKSSAGLAEIRDSIKDLNSGVDSTPSAVPLPINHTKYMEKIFSSLTCEEPSEKNRLSVNLTQPPDYFPDWLGEAIGILWVLPQQLIMLVDERLKRGEELCIYSFHANETKKVSWTSSFKPNHSRVRAVLCQDVDRRGNDVWFLSAAGNEIFLFSLDLTSDDHGGCRIKGKRTLSLKLPSSAVGISAIAWKREQEIDESVFMVTTASSDSSMLSIYDWYGKHKEDIALSKLSNFITDIALRPEPPSLVICDAEAAIVKAYDQQTFSTRRQYNFTLTTRNSDRCVPISVTSNRMGDLLVLWMAAEIRKGDIVYSVWNITAHMQSEPDRPMFVVVVGNSLETGIPVSIGCWDYDVAVCFQDGRIKILRNFCAMYVRREDAAIPRAFITELGKRTKKGQSNSNLVRNSSLITSKVPIQQPRPARRLNVRAAAFYD